MKRNDRMQDFSAVHLPSSLTEKNNNDFGLADERKQDVARPPQSDMIGAKQVHSVVPVRPTGPHIIKPEPQIIRPIALKVANPIPQQAAEEFYRAAAEEGIAMNLVHAAVMQSHDWHRKWTQQDERDHTMPENHTRQPQNDFAVDQHAQIPSHYAYDVLDREHGAKNPSPGEKDSLVADRKRDRTSTCWLERVVSPDPMQQLLRQDNNITPPNDISPLSDEDDDDDGDHATEAIIEPDAKRRNAPPTRLVRPVALRISRPAVVPPPEDPVLHATAVPRDIARAFASSFERSLSPLTLPSLGNSSRHSFTSHNGKIHIIKDEEVFVAPLEIVHPAIKSVPRAVPEGMDAAVQNARDGILHELAISEGEATSERFQACLNVLSDHFNSLQIDTCHRECSLSEGLWLTLTKPTFFGNLGDNDQGDPMYTLGRMAFDMFAPTSLVCSLQGNFNSVERVSDSDRLAMQDCLIPKALQEDYHSGRSVLRTYNVVAAFTIEPPLAAYPQAPNKDVRRPIRAIMTVNGYTLGDPQEPNRHSVWITGGSIEPNNDPRDEREWKRLFRMHPPKHGFAEKAKLLAVKLLMGATIPEAMKEDGSMSYEFTRPLGGHGMAYVDTIYADKSFRIVRGHRGTLFVFSRQDQKDKATTRMHQ